MDLITLSDLPELAGADPKPRTTITIGRLDDNLRDPRYGKFAITQKQVDSWKKNLAGVMGGQVSIDFDHSSDRGNGTRAAAWIKSIDQTGTENGALITANVEFSKRGARAVRNGDYKYTSPTFVENYTDEHGDKHGPALIGAALTNRPVLRKGMPTLSLSKDEFDGVATPERARDSRSVDLTDVAKLLGLDENADLPEVVAGVVTLQKAAVPASPSRTPNGPASSRPTPSGRTEGNPPADGKAAKKARKLAKRAKAKQTMALSDMPDEKFAQLLLDANAGASAATQLAEQTFNHAWEKALSEGRVAPSQEDTIRELHQMNPALAIKTLDSFVPIVPTKPQGSGEGPITEAPMGMELDRFQLHTEAKALSEQMVRADPKMDPGEAYTMAAVQIEDRKFQQENPGQI